MSKKKELTPEEVLTKLKAAAKSKARCKYSARTHEGKGHVAQVYEGGRGAWVQVVNSDKQIVTIRPSQVALY